MSAFRVNVAYNVCRLKLSYTDFNTFLCFAYRVTARNRTYSPIDWEKGCVCDMIINRVSNAYCLDLRINCGAYLFSLTFLTLKSCREFCNMILSYDFEFDKHFIEIEKQRFLSLFN